MNATQEANRTFYDRISSTYDMIADAGEHQARETGERLLAPRAGESVLEIGYGTGNSLITLAKLVGESGRVVGLDISDGMRQVASRKIDEAGVSSRVQLDIGDARKLPYAENTFDAAFMSFTLELFAVEDIPKVLAEIRRVLRPGGRLGVVSMAVVPDGESPSLLERTYVWMHRNFPHIVDCQPIDVECVLRTAGFEIGNKNTMDIWTMPVVAAVGVC